MLDVHLKRRDAHSFMTFVWPPESTKLRDVSALMVQMAFASQPDLAAQNDNLTAARRRKWLFLFKAPKQLNFERIEEMGFHE